MQSKWIRFSNGRVWRVVDGLAVGTVVVPNYEEIVELGARLEQIAEAATGSIVGLMDFEYENRGGNVVTFKGSVEHMFDKYPEELTELAEDSDELRAALTAQYGLSRPELLHAMANLKTKRSTNETTLPVWASGRSLHYPAEGEAPFYARVVIDGLEVEYLRLAELQSQPEAALGSLLDAAAAAPSRD
jgi:hypothetical protein